MLTFEEFFAKKKIDLTALKKADETLFLEFQEHYLLMGEKSFDHSKKFWFNQLRRIHPLAEVAVVAPQKESDVVLPTDNNVEQKTKTATAEKPAGFKPRFKAAVKPAAAPENKTEENTDQAPAVAKPSGFKPRFKAGATKTTSAEQETKPTSNPSESAEETSTEPVSKPAGFKPRFKAGVTNTTSAEQETAPTSNPSESAEETPTEPVNKPAGFKPRFKAGITKIKPSEEDNS